MLLGFLIFLGCIGIVLLSIPRAIFRVAWQNGMRRDGTWSRRRTLIEFRHFADLLGALLLALVLFATVTGGTLVLFHTYIAPIPLIADVFSVFNPDPEIWEAQMEKGDLGDLGEAYEQWSAEQGFSEHSARFWQDFLWENWVYLAAATLFLGGFFYWFIAKYYVKALAHYCKRVLKRQKKYLVWDVRKAS